METLPVNTETPDTSLTPVNGTPVDHPLEDAPAPVNPDKAVEGPGRILSFEEGLDFSLTYYDEALHRLAQ